ncbi:unnamed protein product [Rotaria sp. Silwood2]|nr:unnamed protein product [Rotaria sp. Silwood2]CAF2916020.1 unnamed protein product [Rotaria sp. Silwood2]CAF3175964.1 unnamed protein product [Rotaria sp. Silwood2]CAF3316000.1 unnamed protein product [Rotaria sp. Silwood2]CAF4092597.1 unnamed protein product [Rotaria sp. Silwood2]
MGPTPSRRIQSLSKTSETLTKPYEILGGKKSDTDYQLRLGHRTRIHEYKQYRLQNPENRKIVVEIFRIVFCAYETLSDHDKRHKYDQNEEWIKDVPLEKYT